MSSEDTKNVVESFYRAFSARDGERMADFYGPDSQFEDPAFGKLSGAQIGGMWQMLIQRTPDLELRFEIRKVEGARAEVQWEAKYTFARTGRKVINCVESSLVVQGQKITEHRDRFSFWKWSRQALGPVGFLLGGFGFFEKSLQTKARKALGEFFKPVTKEKC